MIIFAHKYSDIMKDFFTGIQDFFEGVLFTPLHYLRSIELDNWWAANTMTWIFALIGIVAFTYWMIQLKKFNDNNEEDKSISSHSFL